MSVAVMRFSRRAGSFACAVACARLYLGTARKRRCVYSYAPGVCDSACSPADVYDCRPASLRPGPVVFASRQRVCLKIGQRSDAPDVVHSSCRHYTPLVLYILRVGLRIAR